MKISYNDIPLLQPLVKDYLNGNEGLKPLYNYPPDVRAIENAIHIKTENYTHRSVLVEALKSQYKSVQAHETVSANLELLAEKHTFTVTTAHQPNLFAGPLYFAVKILSAVSTARLLKEHYPNNNFVPVYWMGSEDHDAEELNNINLFNSKIEWQTPYDGAFGRLPTDSLAPLIEEINRLLDNSAYQAQAHQLLKDCYVGQKTIAQATRALVNTLFGKYGVIVVDGDDAPLKALYKSVIKDELLNQSSKKLADENSAKLEALGYTPQAFARPINLFYLDAHSRNRIEKDNDTYKINQTDKTFTQTEILELADAQPEMFSPNVILRGLYQETVLPNLIFIGGGAEVSYWLQLKGVFDYHNIAFPMLVQRDMALLLDTGFTDKWSNIGFEMADLFKDEAQLIKTFMDRQTDMAFTDFTIETEEIAKLFNSIKAKIAQIDKTLMPATDAEFVKVRQIIDGLSNRGTKALKRRYDTSIQTIKNNKQKYFPGGTLQERHYNFLQWYARYGDTWFDTLLNAFNPFDKALTIIEL